MSSTAMIKNIANNCDSWGIVIIILGCICAFFGIIALLFGEPITILAIGLSACIEGVILRCLRPILWAYAQLCIDMQLVSNVYRTQHITQDEIK